MTHVGPCLLQEEGEDDDQTVRTGLTNRARTARRSEWATTAIFSDGKTAAKSGARSRATARTATARIERAAPNAAAGALYEGEGDVVDLLDARTSRRMVGVRAGPVARAQEDSDFDMDDGRLVIREEDGRQVIFCSPFPGNAAMRNCKIAVIQPSWGPCRNDCRKGLLVEFTGKCGHAAMWPFLCCTPVTCDYLQTCVLPVPPPSPCTRIVHGRVEGHWGQCNDGWSQAATCMFVDLCQF